jgi:5'-nucleotidase
VPAIAGSAGLTETTDYESVAALIVDYITEHRSELAEGTASADAVVSFNVPECTAGSVRELVEVPLATVIPEDVDPFETDCSVEPTEPPQDDVTALVAGHAAVTLVPPEEPTG